MHLLAITNAIAFNLLFQYNKNMKSFRALFFAALVAFGFSSCSGVIGYGVVLWNINEYQIPDGTIVPVYLKSNISRVYVIGLPDSKEKTEVPLWKISEPQSKRKAQKYLEQFAAYEHRYAKCVLDGLPIRSDKINTSKQVYRLRKDEVLRVLYEDIGHAPTTGQTELEGTWLRVLTSDGTEGWCFSHNLRLFTMYADGTMGEGAKEADVQEEDIVLESMLSKKWYPENYGSMLASGAIDLEYMNSDYGFDTGKDSGVVSLHLKTLDVSYPFAGVTRTSKNIYKFNDVPIQVTVKNENFIIVQHTDEKGMPHSYNFITIEVNIEQRISEEIERRNSEYNALCRFGPDFRSNNYGSLSFYDNSVFQWTGFNLLVPALIARSAKGSGYVRIKYILPNALKQEWDGVLTFMFEGMENEVNFLYKKESNGLRLTNASVAAVNNGTIDRTSTIVSRPPNSMVMFFTK